MNNTEKLYMFIKSNNGLVTTKEVEDNGIPRQYLSLLVADGKLYCIAQGIYLLQDAFEDTMYLIQCRFEKIIFSNETALNIYELTYRDPLQYFISLARGYGATQLRESGLVVYPVKKELHEVGKEKAKTVQGRDVFVYNLERTICDIIRCRNQMVQICSALL